MSATSTTIKRRHKLDECLPFGSAADPVLHDLGLLYGTDFLEEGDQLLRRQPRRELLHEHSATVSFVFVQGRRFRLGSIRLRASTPLRAPRAMTTVATAAAIATDTGAAATAVTSAIATPIMVPVIPVAATPAGGTVVPVFVRGPRTSTSAACSTVVVGGARGTIQVLTLMTIPMPISTRAASVAVAASTPSPVSGAVGAASSFAPGTSQALFTIHSGPVPASVSAAVTALAIPISVSVTATIPMTISLSPLVAVFLEPVVITVGPRRLGTRWLRRLGGRFQERFNIKT